MKNLITSLFVLCFFFSQVQSQTKSNDISKNFCLIHTNCKSLKEAILTAKYINNMGGQVSVIGSPTFFIGWISPEKITELVGKNNITSIYNTSYAPEKSALKNDDEMVMVNYFNSVINKEYLKEDVSEITDMGSLQNDCFFSNGKNYIEPNQNGKGTNEIMSHSYCDGSANSEFMKGTIASAIFLVESDGTVDANSYTWTTTDESTVKTQVVKSFNYWAWSGNYYDGVSMTFTPVYYDHTTPTIVNQPYEPITRNSYLADYLWTEAIMGNMGYTSGTKEDKVNAYNTHLRDSLGTDHSYSTFFSYNPPSQGAPSTYPDGFSAYGTWGGPACWCLYKNGGWAVSDIYKVFGHESGHVFHAFDEYSSSYDNCNYSFNGILNSNFHGSPCNGSETCVMLDISTTGSGFKVCQYTRGILGWTSALTPAPSAISPADNSSVGNEDIAFSWNRNTTNEDIYTYLIIYKASTGEQEYCNYFSTDNTTISSLNPGDYKWTLVNGNSDQFYGYAMVESSELRNLTLIVTTPHPDLVAQNQSVSPATAKPGSVVMGSCDVKNQGKADAASTTLKYYLSGNTTYETGDTELDFDAVGSLSVDATSSLSETFTIPKGTGAGTWYILFFADATEQVIESNENNNVSYFAITIDTSTTVNCTNTVTTFPYNEGFESGLGKWEQSIDDECEWTRYSYPTPSNYTGPEAAHGGSYYLYTEASDCYNTKTAILTGPCFDFTSRESAELSFWYHMYSQINPEEMGILEIQVSLDGGTNWSAGIWSLAGNQGSNWLNAIVDLTSYCGQITMLRFKGTTGSGTASDMAFDDVNITVGLPTGISDSYDKNLKIYPNPASGNIYVALPENPDNNIKITVSNILGEEVLNTEINAIHSGIFRIDISSIPQGVYYINVQANDNIFVKKFSVIK